MRKKYQPMRTRVARYRRVHLPRRIRRFKLMSRHPYAVPFLTIGVLLIITAGIGLVAHLRHQSSPQIDAKIVIISHDHEQQIVPSREETVGGLIQKLHIPLNQGDVVEPAAKTVIDQDEFRINIYRAVPVEIVDGDQHTYTFSAATTPRSIAEQAGKTLYSEDDITTTPAQNFLKADAIGEQVVIDRAVPVNMNLYGTPLAIRTHAKTVGDLIQQKGIKLAKDDQVLPAADTPLTPNTQVFIVRNGTKIESESQVIAMPVQTIQDPTLAYGTSAIRQQGSAGTQVLTYQDMLQNGIVVSRSLIQTVVTTAPVTAVVVVGTSLSGIKGDMALAGIDPSDYEAADYVISHESGWCPTKAQGEHTCPPIPDNAMTSNGYGLCQATPGYKMASAGSDWETNPITQLKWCTGYADGRYGGWQGAYDHWLNYHNW
jgi:resuscitation-promoting factor RpfB